MQKQMKTILITLLAAVVFLAACSPTVAVQAPDKPIEINMNVKIQQEVRIKVDKELEALFEKDSELFGTTAKQAKK